MAQKNPIVSDSDIPMRKVSSASSSPIDFCQVPPPFVPVKYTSISKGFGESKKSYLMCGNKIAKYESRHMEGWRALLMVTNTILCNWATWYKLLALTVVCFLAMGFVFATESQKSIGDSDVPGRVQFLLSFVLSAYVGLYIARYNNVRHNTLGIVWGNVETIALYSHQLFSRYFNDPDPKKRAQAKELHATAERYSLCVFRLLFLAAQGSADVGSLVEKKLLSMDESAVLSQAISGTRALVVLGWLSSLFEKANALGYTNFILMNGIVSAISGARGGVGATMGVLGTPLPFIYTHLVYWIVQVLLLVIAISTGINLAVYYDRRQNGDEMYAYDDDGKQWPYSPNRFYANYFLQQTAGNMIFAVFVEGLLFCCGEIENPMSTRSGALPDEAFFCFIHNNIKALTIGRESFHTLPVATEVMSGVEVEDVSGIPPEIMMMMTMGNRSASANGGGDGSGVYMKRQVRVADMSSVDLSRAVEALGEDVYRPIASALVARGITGEVFVSLSADELRDDFGVVDKYHLRAVQSLQRSICCVQKEGC